MATLKSYDDMEYHPMSEEIVNILTQKTQNTSRHFFRILTAYYLSKVSSTMRCTVNYLAQKEIPLNTYALNLAESGFGKGMSTSIIEDQIINRFYQQFTSHTFQVIAEKHLDGLAFKRSNMTGIDHATELDNIRAEFQRCGKPVFSFDSGSAPALKQLRQLMLMADCGSLNFEMDEVGSNLLNNTELLNTFLELYDVGKVKPKLTKNTTENKRDSEILGRSPANMMLFGTPSKLLNGAKEETELYCMFDTGYGRRFWFGYSRKDNQGTQLTPEEIYDLAIQGGSAGADAKLEKISIHLGNLAQPLNHKLVVTVPKEVSLLLITYHEQCKAEAAKLPAHAEIKKAELEHRYFRILKLAGTYAFIDGTPDVTEDQLYAAIKLAIDSGAAFERILSREKPHIKLARYISEVSEEVTQSDLLEDLPFYKGTNAQKQEMMTLATAWGYKNNVIIKKSYVDGIEFYRGESLKETNLSEMLIGWSSHVAYDYRNEIAPFDQLHQLTQADGLHWISHHLKEGDSGQGHRADENVLPGFNLVVLDLDGGVPLEAVKNVLKDQKYLIYTTKRHTEDNHRFRVVLPTSHVMKLTNKDYRDFMKAVCEWFPFEIDEGTFQASKKWLSHDGDYYYNDGDLFDVLPFIPRTSKDEERKKLTASQSSLNNLERWVLNNTGDGNRNNNLMRYAFIMLDMGADFVSIQEKVLELNEKMPDKLAPDEINNTIMKTVARKAASKQQP